YSNRAVSSSSREKPSWLRSWSMTRSPFLWTSSPTQHERKSGFWSLLCPTADGQRRPPRRPSPPHTSNALYRYPYASSQLIDCPVTIDSHVGRHRSGACPPGARISDHREQRRIYEAFGPAMRTLPSRPCGPTSPICGRRLPKPGSWCAPDDG